MKSAFPVFSCILGAATTLHALALPQVDQGATGTGVTVETAEDLGAWPPLYKRAYLIQDDPPVRLSINEIWALQPEIRGRQDEVIDFVSDFRHYIDEFYPNKGQTLWGTVGIKLLDPESVTYWDLKVVDTAKDKSQLTPGLAIKALDQIVTLFKRYGPRSFESTMGAEAFKAGFADMNLKFPKAAGFDNSTPSPDCTEKKVNEKLIVYACGGVGFPPPPPDRGYIAF